MTSPRAASPTASCPVAVAPVSTEVPIEAYAEDASEHAPAPRLILASASPRRRELIVRLGLTPNALDAADLDETPAPREVPLDYARRMARETALSVTAADAFVPARYRSAQH